MTVWKTIAVVFASVILAAAPALAQQVGTATAVNPTSETTPPGGSTVALTVGARVVHKERIHTTPSGSAQLLFLDKSSLSIAPNTSILIDEFVYDPNSGDGHMPVSYTHLIENLATLSSPVIVFVIAMAVGMAAHNFWQTRSTATADGNLAAANAADG